MRPRVKQEVASRPAIMVRVITTRYAVWTFSWCRISGRLIWLGYMTYMELFIHWLCMRLVIQVIRCLLFTVKAYQKSLKFQVVFVMSLSERHGSLIHDTREW